MRSSALCFGRFFCCKSAEIESKKNVVFMGSPKVVTPVLDALFLAAEAPNSLFKLAAIVTQPPTPRDRGRKMLPSPVAQHALDRGFTEELIFTPEKAGDEAFLSKLKALTPQLCITAAYGNILPKKFLGIPTCGTVNIHPSLLPLYRGAAPVQRALQDGVSETGVSLAYTVRALDSGPVIAYETVSVDENIKAPELLASLFNIGAELLTREIASILDGSAISRAHPQDESKATFAPKINKEESWLSFDDEARVIHNKVRAFAGWPGTQAKFQVIDNNGSANVIDIKIITTRVGGVSDIQGDSTEIVISDSALLIPCGKQSWLEVLELQPPGKRIMKARDFWNGLRGQKLKLI